MNKVCHLIRGFLLPTETFVLNQISNHQKYIPFLIFCELHNNLLTKNILTKTQFLNCINTYYGSFLYKYFRKLTKEEEQNCIKFILSNKIDIIHVHYGPDYYVYKDVIKLSGKPSIVSFYGYDSSSFQYQYWGYGKQILTKVFKSADYCLAMSEDMKLDLISLGCSKEKIIIHYFGCELSRFDFHREYKLSDRLVILTVASLVPKKGHINIMKAINLLNRTKVISSDLVKFRFIGDGPLKKKLVEYSIENGIEDFVEFVGYINYSSEEYIDELKNADVFLHPSIKTESNEKEGIPTTIVEAMASGLPIISTYHAGIPSIIQDGFNGLMVEENNINELSNSIKSMIQDHTLRETIGKNGKYYAINNLNIKVKTLELEKLYDDLLEKEM